MSLHDEGHFDQVEAAYDKGYDQGAKDQQGMDARRMADLVTENERLTAFVEVVRAGLRDV